jgi:hypothetical protein
MKSKDHIILDTAFLLNNLFFIQKRYECLFFLKVKERRNVIGNLSKDPRVSDIALPKIFFYCSFSFSLHWICGHTKRDQIINNDRQYKVGMAPIEKKLVQHRL